MNVKTYRINYCDEARLHYMKKIKGEMIEKIEESHKHGAETDVLRDIIGFLDNSIYEAEERVQKIKKASREQEDITIRSLH